MPGNINRGGLAEGSVEAGRVDGTSRKTRNLARAARTDVRRPPSRTSDEGES